MRQADGCLIGFHILQSRIEDVHAGHHQVLRAFTYSAVCTFPLNLLILFEYLVVGNILSHFSNLISCLFKEIILHAAAISEAFFVGHLRKGYRSDHSSFSPAAAFRLSAFAGDGIIGCNLMDVRLLKAGRRNL